MTTATIWWGLVIAYAILVTIGVVSDIRRRPTRDSVIRRLSHTYDAMCSASEWLRVEQAKETEDYTEIRINLASARRDLYRAIDLLKHLEG